MSGAQGELPFKGEILGISNILADTAQSIDDLYRAATEPGKDPPWSALFNRIAKSTHMAPFNLMLADLQRPGARYVAFRENWAKVGRIVKPGVIPIIILWPFCPIRCAYDLADTEGPAEDDALLARVFGEPLEMKDNAAASLGNKAKKHDAIETRFVDLGSNLAGDARTTGAEFAKKGETQKPRWLVRIGNHLHDSARFVTLTHELGHIYLGHLGGNSNKWPDRRPPRLDVREFEAEAVSFIVGSRFGLQTSSAEYLRGYIKGDTINHVSFSAIARAAGRIEQHAR
ncbi:hypothetical protein [uncultured Rhodoblastus sp.]|uniref:hypothetical protein n=1 Tax=uncultured Rhodoblastus sp. TaxID=543037 RepID=UPI0025FF45CE|nr:hypothetical protein [uncultured Rhodoblastus sp.]